MIFLAFSVSYPNSQTNISLTSLQGEIYRFDNLIDYPKVIVMFWTTWCHFCRRKMKELNRRNLELNDIKFVFIDLGEKTEVVNDFVDKYDLSCYIRRNIFLDEEGILQRKFLIVGVPTFLFYKEGKLVYQGHVLSDSLIQNVFGDE